MACNKIKPLYEVGKNAGLSYYQKSRELKLDEVFTCKECGAKYTPRQYVKSVGLKTYSNTGCCSLECQKKVVRKKKKRESKGVRDTHRRRARYYGCEYDRTVTLDKLIKHNGLRCAICGELCDPNDHEWTDNFGPSSPTIDHIIPMSKGGGHTWDNVQIAHAICNSKKRDLVEGVNAHDAS